MPRHSIAWILGATLIAVVGLAPSAAAQTSSAPSVVPESHLEFEAATIKPVDPNAPDRSVGTDVQPGGTIKLNGLSLKAIIAEAFNVNYWQVEGGEKWMEDTSYNVVAKPPDAIRENSLDTRHTWFTLADPRLRAMLQSLLIERFKLKVHRIMQPGKVYWLERTAKPLALIPNKAIPSSASSSYGNSGTIGYTDQWVLFDTTMGELATFASSYILHRPVLDHTDLTGAYDYRTAPEDRNPSTIDQSASFIEMLNQVGLKLEPAQGNVDMLIIDHAELPTPN
jgi:uncharacterized protein (TIGR03435 family)